MGHQCYRGKKQNTIMHGSGLDSRTQHNYKSTRAHSKKSPRGMWMVLHVNGAPGQGMYVNRGMQARMEVLGDALKWPPTTRDRLEKESSPLLILLLSPCPLWTEPGTGSHPAQGSVIVSTLIQSPCTQTWPHAFTNSTTWMRETAWGKSELRANAEVRQFVISI